MSGQSQSCYWLSWEASREVPENQKVQLLCLSSLKNKGGGDAGRRIDLSALLQFLEKSWSK